MNVGDSCNINLDTGSLDCVVQSPVDSMSLFLTPGIQSHIRRPNLCWQPMHRDIVWASLFHIWPTFPFGSIDVIQLLPETELSGKADDLCENIWCLNKKPCKLHHCFNCDKFVILFLSL